MISCMGGWCKFRETCFHYVSNYVIVQERLCKQHEHYRHLLGASQTPVSGALLDPIEVERQGQGPSGVVWRRQEVARVSSEEPAGIQ